jgi:uncharacterized protein (DUF983 family)
MDTSAASARQRIDGWVAIKRGWAKKCPHCGQGPIFIKWNKPYRNCPVCGYLYERDYGDVWWVWIITDRIPIAIGIVFVYFGFRVTSWKVGVPFFSALVLPLVLTIPRRFGLAIALAYLSRRRWPDSNDPMPPLPADAGAIPRA